MDRQETPYSSSRSDRRKELIDLCDELLHENPVPASTEESTSAELLDLCNEILDDIKPPEKSGAEPEVKSLGHEDDPEKPISTTAGHWENWPVVLMRIEKCRIPVLALVIFLIMFKMFLKKIPVTKPLPQAFVVPAPKSSDSGFVPNKMVFPIEKERIAEMFLCQGANSLDQGNPRKAIDYFMRACATMPGHPKYRKALETAKNRLNAQIEMTAIVNLAESGNTDEAWKKFQNAVSRDPFFFPAECPRFADVLEKTGNTASAVSLLLTYNRMRPSEKIVQHKLENLIRRFRNEGEKSGREW